MKHPYSTAEYAQSLAHSGRPLHIPEWNTWVLTKEIDSGYEDAIGTYPITILNTDADIIGGLKRLQQHGLVSVVFVLDDFNRPCLDDLQRYFTIFSKFKTHYVYKPKLGNISYNRHHRYELRQAVKAVRVGPLDLDKNLTQWSTLYTNLIVHKKLSGLHAFPLAHHSILSKLAGVTAIGAWQNDELVSCHIWVSDGKHVHSHLAASNTQGYTTRAAYAVNNESLYHFANVETINFGGGSGNINNPNDGLARFKRGFSNCVAQSYLCGAVLDNRRYMELLSQRKINSCTDYFPAYRGANVSALCKI